jgi:outer membrane protein OmpA-like peptidoglycan-associated protein
MAEAERAQKAAAAAQQQSLAAQRELAAAQQLAEAARQQAEDARKLAQASERDAASARAAQQDALSQASEATRRAEQAAQERDALAQQLESSLNAILDTKRGARGLVVNIGDVLFDLGQATLRPEARERLSRLCGVLLAYPGPYTLTFEGHTDSTGSDELNNRLSDARAAAVRDYIVGAGIRGDRVVGTRGLGKSNPVASNDTSEGRQLNRRVEVVIDDAR